MYKMQHACCILLFGLSCTEGGASNIELESVNEICMTRVAPLKLWACNYLEVAPLVIWSKWELFLRTPRGPQKWLPSLVESALTTWLGDSDLADECVREPLSVPTSLRFMVSFDTLLVLRMDVSVGSLHGGAHGHSRGCPLGGDGSKPESALIMMRLLTRIRALLIICGMWVGGRLSVVLANNYKEFWRVTFLWKCATKTKVGITDLRLRSRG
jgi:hypothetical protein